MQTKAAHQGNTNLHPTSHHSATMRTIHLDSKLKFSLSYIIEKVLTLGFRDGDQSDAQI